MSIRRAAGEEGTTLVETALVCLIMAVVLAVAFPTVPLFFSESTAVQNTYNAVDQLVLASEVATRYLHEAVDPTPTSQLNAFNAASANAVTFYANTGNANGPEKVVITVTTSGSTRSFKADIYSPAANSCPFSLTSGLQCTYGSSTRSILLINYLTNGTAGSPVFTYTLDGGGTCGGPPPGTGGSTLTAALTGGVAATTLHVAALTTAVASGDTLDIGTGSSTQTVTASAAASTGATSISINSFTPSTTIASGTSVYDQTCSATALTEVEAVSMSLSATQNPGGQPTGYQTQAYLFSPNYSTSVG